MVRSLYSGVAGMKVHQTRMDVIGNNISNVNTYGFKASRATFADLYYQTLSSATRASAVSGGTNPSQIGYGVQFGGVDLLMERAAFTTTDRGLDVAIAGEGFFQVQDSEGNIFYTRAGILAIDTAGNLVDKNGNFVLGISGSSLGRSTDNMKIRLSVPAVSPTQSSATETINGVKFTITSSNRTEEGNITFKFISDDTLPGGLKAKADITASGITIRLNANETFYNLSELNTEINRAITQANGGKPHPAGNFTISTEPANVFPGKSAVNGYIETTPVIEGFAGMIFNDTVSYVGLGSAFSGVGSLTFRAVFDPGTDGIAGNDDDIWHITATDSKGTVFAGDLTNAIGPTGGNLKLQNGTNENDYISINVPSLSAMTAKSSSYSFNQVTGISVNRNSKLQGGLSIRSVSVPFYGEGAVAFKGVYTADDPATSANEEKVTVTADINGVIYSGTITPGDTSYMIKLENASGDYIILDCPKYDDLRSFVMTSASGVDIKTETAGLNIKATKSTPFIGTGLTGREIASNDFSTKPGVMTLTGADLSEGILGGLQFVTTSSGFTVPNDLANVQFDSEYIAGDNSATPPTSEGWKITATIGNDVYVGYVTTNMTAAGSFLLKNSAGEYIEMSHPGITEMNASIGINADSKPTVGVSKLKQPVEAVTITSAKKSNALGLSSKDIKLTGGTAGGTQSISDLTNLAISSDGTITATHSIHGTIELGRIILATFDNPQGLEEVGNSYFVESANSGPAKLAVPGESGTGKLVTSALEMSNVDLSKEFTEMITTQRGFQANSRVITVSDTLLEELINLKR